MPDFGALSALSGVDDWSEIRREKSANLQRLAMLKSMTEQKLAQNNEAAQYIQQHLDEANNFSVLDPDHKKILEKSNQLIEPIVESIKKYHGSASDYLNSGEGLIELQKYGQQLVNSDEVKNGLQNAQAHKLYEMAIEKGLTPSLVPITGKDGKVEYVPYEEQYNQYNNGKLNQLRFNGAYEQPEGDPAKHFAGLYGNAEQSPQTASTKAVYDYWKNDAKWKGGKPIDREQVAQQKAAEYDANPEKYQYKAADPVKRNLEQQKFQAYQAAQAAKVNAAVSKSNDPMAEYLSGRHGTQMPMTVDANSYGSLFGIPSDPKAIGQNVPLEGQTAPVYSPITIPADKDDWAENLGLRYDKKNNQYVGKMNTPIVYSGVNLSPTLDNINKYNYTIKDLNGTVNMPGPNGKQRSFLSARIVMSANDMINNGLMQNRAFGLSEGENAASQGQARKEPDGRWSVPVLIPKEFDQNNPTDVYTQTKMLKTHKLGSAYINAAADKNLAYSSKFLQGVTADDAGGNVDEEDDSKTDEP